LQAVGAQAVPAGDHVDWVLAVGADIWVSASTEVQRFDGNGRRTASVPAPEVCAAMDANAGSLWVASCSHTKPTLIRIDTTTGRALATIALPSGGVSGESSVAAADDGIWVVGGEPPSRLIVIDPVTNKVAKTIAAPPGASAVRAGFDSVWVTTSAGELLRLDPTTGATKQTIRVGPGARFLAIGFESVWVLNQSNGSVSRVDPRTNEVLATIDIGLPVAGGDVAVGPDAVWVHPTDALAVRIDPATNRVTQRIGTEIASGGIAATATALWLTEHHSDTLWRVPL
jgi:virginiamycin B lyase